MPSEVRLFSQEKAQFLPTESTTYFSYSPLEQGKETRAKNAPRKLSSLEMNTGFQQRDKSRIFEDCFVNQQPESKRPFLLSRTLQGFYV